MSTPKGGFHGTRHRKNKSVKLNDKKRKHLHNSKITKDKKVKTIDLHVYNGKQNTLQDRMNLLKKAITKRPGKNNIHMRRLWFVLYASAT